MFLVCFLFGCSKEGSFDNALKMRDRILAAQECRFQAEITADYGDKIQSFVLSCKSDAQGNIEFTVVAPETISGISGKIDEIGGNLQFDHAMLAFPLLADNQLSPVSAPWILMRSLRSGYIEACGSDTNLNRATIYDSYSEDALQIEVWFDDDLKPVQADIVWDGRRILTVVVSNFTIM